MPDQKLTVSGHYRPGWPRWRDRLDQLPYLPLLGSWLREAGFEVGDRVRVREAAPGQSNSASRGRPSASGAGGSRGPGSPGSSATRRAAAGRRRRVRSWCGRSFARPPRRNPATPATVAISLALIPLRRQRPLYWWLILSGTGLLMVLVIVLVGRQGPAEEVVGGLILYLLPLVLMFLVLRADVFARRLYLIPLLGPLVYLVGVALSLSVVVSLGILQP